MNMSAYNERTLLKDEHVQELEENNMKWDVIGLGEVRKKRKVSQLSKVATCCTTMRPIMDKQV